MYIFRLPLVLLLILSLLSTILLNPDTAAAQDFEEFLRAQEEALTRFEAAQTEGVFAQIEAWEAFRQVEQARFEDFREAMTARWGSFRQRSQKRWVEYTDEGDARWEVDFEEGEVVVEVAQRPGETDEAARQRLQSALRELVRSGATQTGLPGDESRILSVPVLEGQLPQLTVESSDAAIEALAQGAERVTVSPADHTDEDTEARPQADPDPEPETEPEAQPEAEAQPLPEPAEGVLRLNLTLAPDHLQVRAARIREELLYAANRWNHDPALLLAVVHTESYFNPTARSHANALGLMQIVPNTAGRDVYRHLNGSDGIPGPDLLFDPAANMIYGAVYLDLLRSRYIRGVESAAVHEFMIIAAYNTGAGNVARAYTGSTNISRAAQQANQMTADENLRHLLDNLPYQETRDYLPKVLERRAQYQAWLNATE
ncbi:membrane-bound lytic murein transglycosylase C [Cyclonatronum proteinivorum]|uniref:Membrane-bound lytic murein transglycosylase C n=1 Tax=Cyclonatronum proteinivorum TaxID=1457365 RepID=A0A345UNJ1_9BACT|nr:membrane-bound lytic murein transglycosylase C [Cyclonatronum proteinivorum]